MTITITGFDYQRVTVADGVTLNAAVGGEGRGQERLGRHEHHDELGRRGELVPVALAREVVHVGAHVPGVRREPLGAY